MQKGVDMPCQCWMAVNRYSYFVGPYSNLNEIVKANFTGLIMALEQIDSLISSIESTDNDKNGLDPRKVISFIEQSWQDSVLKTYIIYLFILRAIMNYILFVYHINN